LFRFFSIRSGQGHRGSCSDGVANQATHLPMGQVNIVEAYIHVTDSDAELHRSRRAISAYPAMSS
jgi:hypothetical protein